VKLAPAEVITLDVVDMDNRAACHHILEFSARVLATFQLGNLRFDSIPGKIPL
jgi:hypothetical protein